DIPLLAQHFLEIFTKKNNKLIKGFTPQAMDRIIRYRWPGNVRELMNAVERGVVLSRSEYLAEDDFPLINDEAVKGESASSDSGTHPFIPLEQVEKETILRTMEMAASNKSEAARRLGITRKTLHKKLKKYGIMK
ncbi:MAG TPA: two-component system response regulator, partial [Desulfobacteraceae bacterium]|nr:two-component system response regulator [Desulfobacteraceae bacterium]